MIIREDDTGDCYYAIADGEMVVSEAGREANRVHRGEGVGEIALVRILPGQRQSPRRPAPSYLYVLARESFLTIIAGHATGARRCERLVGEHLVSGQHAMSRPQLRPRHWSRA